MFFGRYCSGLDALGGCVSSGLRESTLVKSPDGSLSPFLYQKKSLARK